MKSYLSKFRRVPSAALAGIILMTSAVSLAEAQQRVQVIQVQSSGSSGNAYASSSNSELVLIVQQLQDELRQLRGQLESQNYRMEKMEADHKRRYRDLDRRLSLLMQGGAAAGTTVSDSGSATIQSPFSAEQALASVPSSSQPSGEAVKTPSAESGSTLDADTNVSQQTKPVAEAVKPVDEAAAQKDYQNAFKLVRKREFSQAAEKFEAFVVKYPGSERISNAYYWLGEIYLALGTYDKSEQAFAQVINNYPDANKASDSLYKLGVLKKQVGDKDLYLRYMDQVVRAYPGTRAARMAESALTQ